MPINFGQPFSAKRARLLTGPGRRQATIMSIATVV
jgi:hypothetical protein